MTFRMSKGFWEKFTDEYTLDCAAALLKEGELRLFSGKQPRSPSDPPRGDLIGKVEFGFVKDENSFGDLTDGKRLRANPSPIKVCIVKDGKVQSFRYVSYILDEVWFDGSVGQYNADLNMSMTQLMTTDEVEITIFFLNLEMLL